MLAVTGLGGHQRRGGGGDRRRRRRRAPGLGPADARGRRAAGPSRERERAPRDAARPHRREVPPRRRRDQPRRLGHDRRGQHDLDGHPPGRPRLDRRRRHVRAVRRRLRPGDADLRGRVPDGRRLPRRQRRAADRARCGRRAASLGPDLLRPGAAGVLQGVRPAHPRDLHLGARVRRLDRRHARGAPVAAAPRGSRSRAGSRPGPGPAPAARRHEARPCCPRSS